MPNNISASETLNTYAQHPITSTKLGLKNYQDVIASFSNGAVDAFGALRISAPESVFDSQQTYDKQLLVWNEKLTAGGTSTFNANERLCDLEVTTASGDDVIRQSKSYHRYQPGKSQKIITTYAFGATQANSEKRVGYFDANDGIFLLNRGGSLFIVKRSSVSGSVVDTEVAQASWNHDKMDGAGLSGITLDPEAACIMIIDFEALYVGRVRVSFNIGGQIYLAHEFLHSNVTTTTYIATANLPVRYQITTTALNAAADKFKAICCAVISEGGTQNLVGYPFSVGNLTARATSTTGLALISIRPKATFNSIVNRGRISDVIYNSIGLGADHAFQVYYNTAVTGGAWVSAGADSITEYNITGTTITGGTPIATTYTASGAGSRGNAGSQFPALRKLGLSLDIDGANPQTLTIVVSTLTGTGTAAASIDWNEIR
jgi:hypothetical protein